MEKNKITTSFKEVEEDVPLLDTAIFRFSQESNCVDGGEIETLEIRCESSLGIDRDENYFYVLKTDQWALDSIDDLKKLFDRINLTK